MKVFSKRKYIARMDADDLSEMKRFEKQIELMERDNGDIWVVILRLFQKQIK
jgi:hypothetical protein